MDVSRFFHHIVYPWACSDWNIALNNIVVFVLIFIATPAIIVSFISVVFKLTPRMSNNISLYLNIGIICLMYFAFYWYVAIPLCFFYCLFINWANKLLLKNISIEEMHGITAIGQAARASQKEAWERNSEDEQMAYIDNYKKLQHLQPNMIIFFVISFLSPIIMITILNLFGFGYRFF